MVKGNNSDQVLAPTFESTQRIFKDYSTLKTDNEIYQTLKGTFGTEFLELFPMLTPREILNKMVLKYYPNETTIKAEFIKQVLLAGKSHVTIFEFPLNTSRADLCKINGYSTAFEIKTDLDNLQRLKKQLDDYSQIFEYVCLICSKDRLETLAADIPLKYGLYSYRIYHNKYVFHLERSPIRNVELNPSLQLSLITKEALIKLGKCTESETKEHAIQALLQKENGNYINHLFKKYLKSKYGFQWQFLKQNIDKILEIDYQWFFKNQINPNIIYQYKEVAGAC